MNRRARLASVLLSLLLAAVASPWLGAAFPAPQKYVSDGAEVLDAGVRAELNGLLRAVENETTAEVAVVTVASLDGMSVEEYANRLFKEWGVGKKTAANGLLILVAPPERKMRIEVGYGLEPILPDGLAGEIIRVNFLPSFRSGDYPGGIRAGVTRIASILRARHVLTAAERQAIDDAAHGDLPPALLTIPFFGAFIAIGSVMLGAGFRSKTIFPIVFGAAFGGIPFLMSLIPFFNATPLILGPVAALCAFLGYRYGEKVGDFTVLAAAPTASRRSRRSGWTFGSGSSGSGSSGSSSSSSSSSDSGGSYGGGSSGGGGASGSW